MKLKKYTQFISENDNTTKIDRGLKVIMKFLYDNGVVNWTEFNELPPSQRQWVDRIISSSVESKKDLDELRFRLKFNLCDDIEELKNMLNEYESKEEYEKCTILHSKISELE